MCEEVRPLSEELLSANTKIDFTVPKASGQLSSHSPSQGVKGAHSTSSKRKLDDENDLNVGNEIIDKIVTENKSPKVYGPSVLGNLASAVTKFCRTEARNEEKIKNQKNKYLVASNCLKFYVPGLNEEIIKNKNIYHYYKRNKKRWFDLQNIVLTATSAVVKIANLYLEANNKNVVIQSKDVVVKTIDPIALLGKVNHQITFERKERLKNALFKDYKTICQQVHSNSKQMLGDDLAHNVKKAKAIHSINQSISYKRLGLFSSSPRNPTSFYSSNSKAGTNRTHSLNFQGRKKNFQRPQSTIRWNQKQQPQIKWN